ncbi:MAG: type II toxin-antitoxin system MqsR family toxin [Coriobacteriia bacterium]|nr:type II toxin-antitoxin system MqsR family toxin [Coriobacteriia bacterium]
MATLARLGITIRDAKARILQLTASEYVEGPTPRSAGSSHEAWVFGLRVEGESLYVKLEVRSERSRCVCISFHEPAWPMAFPYTVRRGEGGERGDEGGVS